MKKPKPPIGGFGQGQVTVSAGTTGLSTAYFLFREGRLQQLRHNR